MISFVDEDKLGLALREFIFSSRRSALSRLKSVFRMLLHRRRETRRKVLDACRDVLLNAFDGRDMSSLIDFFLVQSPVDLNEQRMMENVFRVDSISRLTKIIKSENVEQSLKFSALSQLATVTVEGELVRIFVQDVGFKLLLDEIALLAGQTALTPDEKEAAGN